MPGPNPLKIPKKGSTEKKDVETNFETVERWANQRVCSASIASAGLNAIANSGADIVIPATTVVWDYAHMTATANSLIFPYDGLYEYFINIELFFLGASPFTGYVLSKFGPDQWQRQFSATTRPVDFFAYSGIQKHLKGDVQAVTLATNIASLDAVVNFATIVFLGAVPHI